MLRGIKCFLPSLFVDNDEEIVEYAVKPLLARSGPLDDIDVALRLIYALGKMEKWLYADITHFSQFYQYLKEQDTSPASPMTSPDFISNVNCITRNATLFSALESMKFADFAAWSEVRFTAMIKTALTGGNDNFKGTYAVKIGLTVNGLHVEAHYPDDEIENVHKPLLRQLAKRHFASASRRTIVFSARRPGRANPR